MVWIPIGITFAVATLPERDGDRRSEGRGQRSEIGGRRSDPQITQITRIRKKGTEDSGQRSEVRERQRSEVRSQGKTEIRGQRSEVGERQMSEVGGQRSEGGGHPG